MSTADKEITVFSKEGKLYQIGNKSLLKNFSF